MQRLTFAQRRMSAGDWVEVRSKEEILGTLRRRHAGRPPLHAADVRLLRATIPGVPACSQDVRHRQQDRRAADGGDGPPRGLRCDGEAYGGCGAACLIFWKEAWLKPIPGPHRATARPAAPPGRRGQGSTEDDVWAGTRAAGSTEDDPTYRCQATALPAATAPLPWWDVRQYVEDYTSGNVGLRELAGGLWLRAVLHAPPDRYAGLARTAAHWFACTTGSSRVAAVSRSRGRRAGWPGGQRDSSRELDLAPGTPVRVRSYAEILDDARRPEQEPRPLLRRRGGSVLRTEPPVRSRVDRTIDERTGKLIEVRGNTGPARGHVVHGPLQRPPNVLPAGDLPASGARRGWSGKSARWRPSSSEHEPISTPSLGEQQEFWDGWNSQWRFGDVDTFMARQARSRSRPAASSASLRRASSRSAAAPDGWAPGSPASGG